MTENNKEYFEYLVALRDSGVTNMCYRSNENSRDR